MIVRSAVAASGLRSPSRVAASGAGTVSTTASASIAGPEAGWTVHRPSRRSSAATGVAVRISPPAAGDRGVEPLDEDAHAAARGEERAGRRLTGGARAGGAGLRAQADQQAAVLGEGVGDLRGHRPQAQVVGVAGVDAADQRADQAVEHLVAEPGPDGQAQGVALVAGRVPAGQQGLDGGPGLAPPREQAGAGHGRQAGRCAEHQARWQPVELPSRPDERGQARRGHQIVRQAELAGQLDRRRGPGQEHVGAALDARAARRRAWPGPCRRGGRRPPAGPRATFGSAVLSS